MICERDPDGLELERIREIHDFAGERVLDIGAGEGRLTWYVSGRAKHTTGLDVDLPSLALATSGHRVQRPDNVSFVAASAIQLPFTAACFDSALLSWSL